MEKKLNFIFICCPYCGKKIKLEITNDLFNKEHFQKEISCECKKSFQIKYNIPMDNLNISAYVRLQSTSNLNRVK